MSRRGRYRAGFSNRERAGVSVCAVVVQQTAAHLSVDKRHLLANLLARLLEVLPKLDIHVPGKEEQRLQIVEMGLALRYENGRQRWRRQWGLVCKAGHPAD